MGGTGSKRASYLSLGPLLYETQGFAKCEPVAGLAAFG